MRTQQHLWTSETGWRTAHGDPALGPADLVFAFAPPARLRDPTTWRALRERWPDAAIAASSTAGRTCGVHVPNGCILATAVNFEDTQIGVPGGISPALTGARCSLHDRTAATTASREV